MKRTFLAILLATGLAFPVSADVAIKQTTGGKGMGISGTTTGTTYIKGNRMRSDLQMGDKIQSTIFDLDAQKMYMFDSKKKEADVWDMAAFSAEMSKSVDVSGMKASIKPNGQKKAFGALSADGYDMEISVPATARRQQGHDDDDHHDRPGLDRQERARCRLTTTASTRRRRKKAGSSAIRARPRASRVKPRRWPRCIGSSRRSAASPTRWTCR